MTEEVRGNRTRYHELLAVAEREGWRLEWHRSTWNILRCELAAVAIFSGDQRIGGAAVSFKSSDIPNFASEQIAAMILDSLPSRGAGANGRMAA